jgi:hypothetical protein
MNFPAIWKAVSIVVTGSFGVLGLLKEFKDKETKKITRWGYVSLTGILLSTILGTTAQLIESQSDARKTVENSSQTLTLLTDVKRLLTPFDEPEISIIFPIPCDEDRFATFCKNGAQISQKIHGPTIQDRLF